MPPAVRNRVHFKAFGVAARDANQAYNPQKHGHFSAQPFWEPAFWHPEPAPLAAAASSDVIKEAGRMQRQLEQRDQRGRQGRARRSVVRSRAPRVQ